MLGEKIAYKGIGLACFNQENYILAIDNLKKYVNEFPMDLYIHQKIVEISNIIREDNTYSEKQLRCCYKYANNSNEVIKSHSSVNLL